MWGFTCTFNTNKLFYQQKKGLVLLTIFNKEGEIPGHIKAAFHEYEILTVQNLIVLNALL